MTIPLALNSEGEQEWLRLKQHLDWCNSHFALVFIFTDHPQVITVFRRRLAEIYRARVSRLKMIVIPEQPTQLILQLLPQLLNPPLHEQSLHAPCWLDLSTHSGKEWQTARIDFLIRLNEQREKLRNSIQRPLVVILPAGERKNIRELTPDLWAIRDFSLHTQNWLVNAIIEETVPQTKQEKYFPLSGHEKSIINEWKRLHDTNLRDRGILKAADRAFQVYQKLGRYRKAEEVSDWMQCISRKIIEDVGETLESLRDLSVSLNLVGKTAQQMGQWDKASTAFEESLGIRRKIIEGVGETPESLRDLSVSLNNVGKTAQQMGQWEKAATAFEQGLLLAKTLAKALPDHAEYNNLVPVFQEHLQQIEKSRRNEKNQGHNTV